ncbi:MAG TPA: DUF5009 domain-containing protein [Acidobacteriota bacterium]
MATATTTIAPVTQSQPASKTVTEQRYVALDAYRGFIMFVLASEGFGFEHLTHHPTYGRIAAWFDHVPWEGAVFWDLIMPAFMFMVGVAMPFSLARRRQEGASKRQEFWHVVARVLKLLLLSQILIIASSQKVQLKTVNTLFTIAFAYFFTFLILKLTFRWQVVTAVLILSLHWALFALFPGPEGAFSRTGNIGMVIDKALLGHNYPEYGNPVTINFITGTVTMLFGAWTGMLLRSDRTRAQKLKILGIATVAAFAGGLALSPVNPIIKLLWTASFTLYSTGWVLLMMLAFIIVIEVWGYRKFAFPLVVVGMNSIFIYSCTFLLKPAIDGWLMGFTGGFKFVGELAPVAQSCAAMLVLWYLCYWLYQHKIFIKA